MLQAITTVFLGPTNHRGARYKASCEAGSITIAQDDSVDYQENHKLAASALIAKLGWFHDPSRRDTYGDWFGGGQKGEGYVFVCSVDHARVSGRNAEGTR